MWVSGSAEGLTFNLEGHESDKCFLCWGLLDSLAAMVVASIASYSRYVVASLYITPLEIGNHTYMHKPRASDVLDFLWCGMT
jgi:hypothetical protein